MKKIVLLTAVIGFAAALTASAADVKDNWAKTCIKCHGEDGKGQTKMGQKVGVKDFTDAKVQEAFKDDEAFKALKEGLSKDGKQEMKAFSPTLTDDEIKALIAYVRAL